MNRSYESGAKKRKATQEKYRKDQNLLSKIPKISDIFSASSSKSTDSEHRYRLIPLPCTWTRMLIIFSHTGPNIVRFKSLSLNYSLETNKIWFLGPAKCQNFSLDFKEHRNDQNRYFSLNYLMLRMPKAVLCLHCKLFDTRCDSSSGQRDSGIGRIVIVIN